eukprot:TRINITY_DN6890_c0_g2_i2.p1 TRINITY_DN6890_c0_g2~~TRINITY_DN6890_c0_g2_i2.p1  ORF type:complete len:216 (-),score=2.89 TRINITY_DN6890_c0_g2_i2:49-696(-)
MKKKTNYLEIQEYLQNIFTQKILKFKLFTKKKQFTQKYENFGGKTQILEKKKQQQQVQYDIQIYIVAQFIHLYQNAKFQSQKQKQQQWTSPTNFYLSQITEIKKIYIFTLNMEKQKTKLCFKTQNKQILAHLSNFCFVFKVQGNKIKQYLQKINIQVLNLLKILLYFFQILEIFISKRKKKKYTSLNDAQNSYLLVAQKTFYFQNFIKKFPKFFS